jgi:hypothetical protein
MSDRQRESLEISDDDEDLRMLTVASRDDLDERLTDLLGHVYRTKDAQNG